MRFLFHPGYFKEHMTQIISIANEKGGVAKTTTTLSLGGALAEMGYKVLVIDLDPQANLSLSLGTEPAKGGRSIISIFLDHMQLNESILVTNVPNLWLLPSNSENGMAERVLPSRSGYEFFLKNQISRLENRFDYILVDCPPFLGAITTNALIASDILIIPSQPEYYSVFALRNMMGLIRQIRAKGNSGLRYRLLLTMFDKRNGIHRTLAEHLRRTFSTGVLESVIEVDTRLRESPIAGLPIQYHASKSRAAMQYRFLAQEMIQYAKENN
jgi:chromosome partitioning protein